MTETTTTLELVESLSLRECFAVLALLKERDET
jgi:hypothetical protein